MESIIRIMDILRRLHCYVKIRIQQHRMAEDRNQMNMVFHHIPVSLLYILPGGLFRFRHTAIHHCLVPGGTVCRVVRRHGTPVVRSVKLAIEISLAVRAPIESLFEFE